MSAIVASTSAARSATSSDWTRSSTISGSGVAIERRLGAQRLLDLSALLGDARAPLLDLVAALAVGEAPVVEDLAPFAEVLVALGDHRLAALDRGQPLVDLFHRRLVGVQARRSALRRPASRRVLVGVGQALADAPAPATLPGSSRRALSTAITPTAARTAAMTIRTAAMIMSGGAVGGRSGADRQVEWVACLGDEPLGEEVGGRRQGASPVPAEGHGTRDGWIAKRDHRHPGARHRAAASA